MWYAHYMQNIRFANFLAKPLQKNKTRIYCQHVYLNNFHFMTILSAETMYSKEDSVNRFMQQVYGWMAFALAVSGGIAYGVSLSPAAMKTVLDMFGFIVIAEFVLVMVISFLINKINPVVAGVLFIGYAAMNGLTFSTIFLIFQLSSIVSIFGVTAGIFAAMSLYGYTTKRDLTNLGNIAFFGLIGVVVAGLVNLFLHNSMLDTVASVIGVAVFTALFAYDTQRIKEMYFQVDGQSLQKSAIIGALQLYLDFINLFLELLKLFGQTKD